MAVKALTPIYAPKRPPIKLKITIAAHPSAELTTTLNNDFKGFAKAIHNKIKRIQAMI